MNLRQLRLLLHFEVKYQLGSGVFWLAGLVFFLLGFAGTVKGLAFPGFPPNAPFILYLWLGMTSLGGFFLLPVLMANALLRDEEYHTHELIRSAPVRKETLLGSRFGGAFLAGLLACTFCVPGMYLGIQIGAGTTGTFPTLLNGWATTTLPNALLAAALSFAIASRLRNRLLTYGAGFGLFLLYMAASSLSNAPWLAQSGFRDPGLAQWSSWMDPIGLSAFFEQMLTWTAAEMPTAKIGLKGAFLGNRLLWLGISVIALWASIRTYRTHRNRSGKGKGRTTVPGMRSIRPMPSLPAATVRIRPLLQLWQLIRLETRQLTSQRLYPLLLVAVGILFGVEAWGLLQGNLQFSGTEPYSSLLHGLAIETISQIGGLALLIFAGQPVWAGRLQKTESLLEASPVSKFSLVASKWVATWAIPLGLWVTCAAITLLLQLINGGTDGDWLTWLGSFYLSVTPLLFLSLLLVGVHLLLPNRGMAIGVSVVLYVVLGTALLAPLGFDHPLLRWGGHPGHYESSAFAGWSAYLDAFHWKMLYWLGVSVGILGLLVWGAARGQVRWDKADHKPFARLALPGALLAGLALFPILQGASEHSDGTREQRKVWALGYEQKYRYTAERKHPVTSGVELDLVLEPDRHRYSFNGRKWLVNQEESPLTEFWVHWNPNCEGMAMDLGGQGAFHPDTTFSTGKVRLSNPLHPGDSVPLNFQGAYSWNGFTGHFRFNSIVENGSFSRLSEFLPGLGYNPSREWSIEADRKAAGMGQPYPVPSLEQVAGDPQVDARLWWDLRATAPAGQEVLVSLPLISKRTEGEVSHFHFRSSSPVENRIAFASGNYRRISTAVNGQEISVLFHPKHEPQASYLLEQAGLALAFLEEAYGPCPYPDLQMVEISSFTKGFAGTSYPATLYLPEDKAFSVRMDQPRGKQFLSCLVAHELSHQWWGDQLSPRLAEGASTLTEMVAQYSEWIFLRKIHGPQAAREALERERHLFQQDVSTEEELPLLRVTKQPHVAYSKGLLFMAALDQQVGEKRLCRFLRKFHEVHRWPAVAPTSMDLMRAMLAELGLNPDWLDEWWTGTGLPAEM